MAKLEGTIDQVRKFSGITFSVQSLPVFGVRLAVIGSKRVELYIYCLMEVVGVTFPILPCASARPPPLKERFLGDAISATFRACHRIQQPP